MSVFNSGSVGRGNLEKVADTILWFPRRMWFGRSVHVIPNENEEGYKIKRHSKSSSLTKSTGRALGECFNTPSFGIGPVIIVIIAFYVLSCIAALPFLAAGLPLKKIALNRSEKAKAYSLLVNKALIQSIIEKDIKSITKSIESTSEKIKNNKEVLESFNREPGLESNQTMKQEKQKIQKELLVNEEKIKKSQDQLNLIKEKLIKQENKTKSSFEKYKNIQE